MATRKSLRFNMGKAKSNGHERIAILDSGSESAAAVSMDGVFWQQFAPFRSLENA